jgi:predicted transcriptional regulator
MDKKKIPKEIKREIAKNTFIPNEFFSDVLPSLTSLSELKVILFLFRHTYGLKQMDTHTYLQNYKISIRKLAEEVGVTHVSIIKALRNLQDKNYIERHEDEKGNYSYSLKLRGE